MSTVPPAIRANGTPRWSVVKGWLLLGSTARALLPALIAGLPAQQGHGLGRAAVVRQGAEHRVASDGVGQPATAVLDQVVAAGEGGEVDDITARRAVGHDGVVQRRRVELTLSMPPPSLAELPDRVELVSVAVGVVDAAAAAGRVARQGGVGQRQAPPLMLLAMPPPLPPASCPTGWSWSASGRRW